MEHKTLFIVAAGLSSRFNNKPKHLAYIKGVKNIEHTLTLAKMWYSDIYVVINEKASEETIKETNSIAMLYGAKSLLIPSGRGDADALYQALSRVNVDAKCATACWGDAWFKNDGAFRIASTALHEKLYDNIVFDAMCAIEKNPYGWFKVSSTGLILNAVFASDLGASNLIDDANAVHDQCMFNVNISNFKLLYERYVNSIALKVEMLKQSFVSYASMFKLSLSYEISWYKMINWSKSAYNDMPNKTFSIATILDNPIALSFNTEEDLKVIENA